MRKKGFRTACSPFHIHPQNTPLPPGDSSHDHFFRNILGGHQWLRLEKAKTLQRYQRIEPSKPLNCLHHRFTNKKNITDRFRVNYQLTVAFPKTSSSRGFTPQGKEVHRFLVGCGPSGVGCYVCRCVKVKIKRRQNDASQNAKGFSHSSIVDYMNKPPPKINSKGLAGKGY